jgi:ribosomal protein S18 acetylase RimI-like enzyme
VELEVRLLSRDERSAAGGVAARALRDDPLFTYLQGDDPLMRMVGAYSAFREPPRAAEPSFLRRVLRTSRAQVEHRPVPTTWGGLIGGYVVGTASAAPPGACFVDLMSSDLRRPPTDTEGAPGSPDRLARVMSELWAHHSQERHWHVGPVGVEPGLQGRGVGGAVMGLLCAAMDAEGEIAFLETEKPENVALYQRFGFEVVEEARVLDVPNWFMLREPGAKGPGLR